MIAVFSIYSITPVRAGIFFRKIDSIQICFNKNQLVLPGEIFKIGVVSYYKKGKIKKTLGMKGGSVFWWRYESEIIGAKRNNGKITVNSIRYPSKGKYIRIKIWPRKQKELARTLLIPLNYETNVSFNPVTALTKHLVVLLKPS